MKRRLRLLSWQLRGAKKAPEIDAGDIAVVHPDALAARQAFEERMGRERDRALVATLPEGAAPELSEGSEIVFVDESEEVQVDVTDVKALRAAPDGTTIEAHGSKWTKFGTLWFPGHWTSIADALVVGGAAQTSARLAAGAFVQPAPEPVLEGMDGEVPCAEPDPLLADASQERLERGFDLGVLPDPYPDDAPWTPPSGSR